MYTCLLHVSALSDILVAYRKGREALLGAAVITTYLMVLVQLIEAGLKLGLKQDLGKTSGIRDKLFTRKAGHTTTSSEALLTHPLTLLT